MSRRWSARLLTAATAAVATISIVAPGAQAARTSTQQPDGAAVPVTALPFVGRGDVTGAGTGGAGTRQDNAAVSRTCNGGAAVQHPQWFRLTAADYGYLVPRVDAPYFPHGVQQNPAALAVLDARTGRVLACDTVPVRATARRPLSVVAYYTEPVDRCADPAEPQECAQGSLRLALAATSSARTPANDHWQNATRLDAFPRRLSVDTTLADPDGIALADYEHCEQSAIAPRELGTVWYRFIARSTGPLPELVATPGEAWPADAGFRPRVALLEPTTTGPVLVPRSGGDPWDCSAPIEVQRGHTYLLAVYTAHDDFRDSALVPGGQVVVRQKAPAGPVGSLRVRSAHVHQARPARASWTPAAESGVRGYLVSVQQRTASGRWRTMQHAQLRATATSWSPVLSRTRETSGVLRFTVAALTSEGQGVPSSRLLLLARAR